MKPQITRILQIEESLSADWADLKEAQTKDALSKLFFFESA
jgi:hypothetical protein